MRGTLACDAEGGPIMGQIRLNRATGCWIDLFDAPQFGGNACRLRGPADFPGLRGREKEWAERVGSLTVGPTAYVQGFAADEFDDSVLWILPNQSLETVD